MQSAGFALIFGTWGLLPRDPKDWPGKSRPPPAKPPFVVSARPRWRVLVGLLALGAVGLLMMSLLGLLGRFDDGTPAFYLVMAALSFWFLMACLMYWRLRLEVSDKEIAIRRWMGSIRLAPERIIDLERLGRRHALLWILFDRRYRLRWRDEHGHDQRLNLGLSSELENADRLQALIEQRLNSANGLDWPGSNERFTGDDHRS
ncbi:MAG: hypothetical protein ACXIUM_06830 [Wenzhouxiangella sp.]